MRNGKIIVEDTRPKLEEKYNSLDMEYIALEICREDERSRKTYLGMVNQTDGNDNSEIFGNKNMNMLGYSNNPTISVSNLSTCHGNFVEFPTNVADLSHFFKKTFALTWVIFLTLFRYPW